MTTKDLPWQSPERWQGKGHGIGKEKWPPPIGDPRGNLNGLLHAKQDSVGHRLCCQNKGMRGEDCVLQRYIMISPAATGITVLIPIKISVIMFWWSEAMTSRVNHTELV